MKNRIYMENKNKKQIFTFSSTNKIPEDLSNLSHHILRYANSGVSRISFLREISKILLDFFECNVVELWLKKDDKHSRYEIARRTKKSFKFNIISSKQIRDDKNISDFHNKDGLAKLCLDIIQGNIDASFPFITKKGSFWTGNTDVPLDFRKGLNIGESVYKFGKTDDYRSLAIIPFLLGDEKIGLMLLKSKKVNFFSEYKIELIEDFAQTIGVALLNQYRQAALQERIKELTCLYDMFKVVEQSDVSLEEVIYNTLELLPPAWQYPKITHARVILDGYEYITPCLKNEVDKLIADIIINKKKRGIIEVIYSEKQPKIDEGPFLKEERSLIETLAKELALIIEHKESEKDKEKLQDQLRHADRLATVGELSAGVAHELNEPLGTILGFAQLIEKSDKLQKQVKVDIEKIIKSSLHAREIIKKLMFFSKQMEPKKTQVNLNQVVEEGLYFLESRCAKEGIELIRSLEPNLPIITADAIQLNQVLVNLIVNAIQAMPKGGKLNIKTFSTDDYVSLVIQDTGIGMSKEVMKHVFEPFFSTKEIGKGTGLGLSVVHGIVTSHNGIIKVESEVGNGSRFEIQFTVDY